MQAFWESLSLLQKILYCIAVPSTLVLILQMVLLFLGWGEDASSFNPSDTSGLDLDTGAGDFSPDGVGSAPDGMAPGDFGTMRLFTFQGIIAFFCVFGWSGLAFTRVLASSLLSMALAIMLGFLFMFLVALLIRALSKLADDGSISIASTLGYSGTVYLTVPSRGNGHGKVKVNIGGHYNEYDAITDSSVPLPTGSRIRIIDVRGDVVLVEPEQ